MRKHRSRVRWPKEEERNTKFFHGIASARIRRNRISTLWDGNVRLVNKEDIINHTSAYYRSLYTKEDRDMPTLDNHDFAKISEERAAWLEREFEEEEVQLVVFNLGQDRAPSRDGFSMAFFCHFLDIVSDETMVFMREFHGRGKLSKNTGASFIALIPKLNGAESLKNFRPISLTRSLYKILAKVLASRQKAMLHSISFPSQRAFVHGRQILDGVLEANECIHSRNRETTPWSHAQIRPRKGLLQRMGFAPFFLVEL